MHTKVLAVVFVVSTVSVLAPPPLPLLLFLCSLPALLRCSEPRLLLPATLGLLRPPPSYRRCWGSLLTVSRDPVAWADKKSPPRDASKPQQQQRPLLHHVVRVRRTAGLAAGNRNSSATPLLLLIIIDVWRQRPDGGEGERPMMTKQGRARTPEEGRL